MAKSFLDKLFKTDEKHIKKVKARAMEVDALKDEIEKEEIKILDEYGRERKFIDLAEDK